MMEEMCPCWNDAREASANTLASLISHPPASCWCLPLAKLTQKPTLRQAESSSSDTGLTWGLARPESGRKCMLTVALVEIPLEAWLRRPVRYLSHVSGGLRSRAS